MNRKLLAIADKLIRRAEKAIKYFIMIETLELTFARAEQN